MPIGRSTTRRRRGSPRATDSSSSCRARWRARDPTMIPENENGTVEGGSAMCCRIRTRGLRKSGATRKRTSNCGSCRPTCARPPSRARGSSETENQRSALQVGAPAAATTRRSCSIRGAPHRQVRFSPGPAFCFTEASAKSWMCVPQMRLVGLSVAIWNQIGDWLRRENLSLLTRIPLSTARPHRRRNGLLAGGRFAPGADARSDS